MQNGSLLILSAAMAMGIGATVAVGCSHGAGGDGPAGSNKGALTGMTMTTNTVTTDTTTTDVTTSTTTTDVTTTEVTTTSTTTEETESTESTATCSTETTTTSTSTTDDCPGGRATTNNGWRKDTITLYKCAANMRCTYSEPAVGNNVIVACKGQCKENLVTATTANTPAVKPLGGWSSSMQKGAPGDSRTDVHVQCGCN